jgi:hypothetical protein
MVRWGSPKTPSHTLNYRDIKMVPILFVFGGFVVCVFILYNAYIHVHIRSQN